MTKIPKSAMPVAEYIRENVPRPKELPAKHWPDGAFCFIQYHKVEFAVTGGKCPMGLLPEAKEPWPCEPKDFHPRPIGFTKRAVSSFGRWWDSQTDPQDAVDAIWGKE